MPRHVSLAVVVVSLAGLLCATLAAQAAAVREVVPMSVSAFDMQQVRLLQGPFYDDQEANRRYLHFLDPDRLLHAFRVNAGLPAPGEPMGGWEALTCEVRGHFVGHYLSACALMFASTGDEGLRERADLMVAELARCQEALGEGYLSAFPKSFWDRLEGLQNPPWAPFYVIHKIMAGMLDVYAYCGNQQALEVARGMAGYFKARFDKLSIWQVDQILGVEFGGMSEVLHNLYAITGDPDHLALAHQFDRATFLGPLVLEHDNLSRIHANTHIPEISGAARRYELLGDERYRLATEFFYDCVADHRSYCTGGSNSGESWPDPDKLAATLAPNTQECCTVYNMLKVARYLFRWTADPAYADYYERNILNGVLGTMDPATGMTIYYQPLCNGARKVFGTPYDSFWCCTGTGVETFSKLNDSIFFHDDDTLYVNLFIPAEVNWAAKGLRLRQTTAFPAEEGTTLTVIAPTPVEMTLKLRVPWWVSEGYEVRVNGEVQAVEARPTSYVELRRTWRDGDRVEVKMPMKLWACPMPDDPELVAFMYGPLTLAGLADSQRVFLGDPAKLAEWVKPVEGQPLTFVTEGTTLGDQAPLTLKPLNQVLHDTYGVYWIVTPPGSARHQEILAEEAARAAREARLVDRAIANNAENEAAHNLQGERHSSGPYGGRGWRHAPDGWFSWDLAVLPDTPMTLSCMYWGSDIGPRVFDVLVDGQVLVTQSLGPDHPGRFYNVDTPIPPEFTEGKTKVTVTFRAHPGNTAGGVFECETLRP